MLISVVTPSYRQLDWLRLCIASVADQVQITAGPTLGPGVEPLAVEHIVQDAGTPGVELLLREPHAHPDANNARSGSHDTPARLSVHVETDQGMYDAINRGFSRAEGEVFAYLNCDEQYLPGTLSRVAAHFAAHPELEVLFAAAIVVDASGRYICDRRPTLPTRSHTLVSGSLSFFTSSTFFRASVLRRRGLWFDATWRAMGDAAWALRLVEERVRMEAVAWPAAIHTDTGSNLALSEGAREERVRLANGATRLQRIARSLIVGAHRARKLATGAYDLQSHCYRIFTLEDPSRRSAFTVERPTWRWRR